MPIYEYRCTSCKRHFETMQRMSEPPLTTCDECGGKVEKLISAPAFQFKGSGWYVTDYARKSEEGKDQADGGGKSDDKKGDEKKGEEKKGADKSGDKKDDKPKSQDSSAKSDSTAKSDKGSSSSSSSSNKSSGESS